MSGSRRRFYSAAAAVADGDRFVVQLDGRTLRTPAGAVLRLPTRALAEAVASEWAAQGERILPESMPLFGLVAAAYDRVQPQRTRVVERLLEYVATDLVCYRVGHPADLVAEQDARWQPLVDWIAETRGVRLNVTVGVVPVSQPPDVAVAVRPALDALDPLELAALASAVQAAGSLVIGLALLEGRLDAENAFAAACLDEIYQADRWGHDPEADRRRDGLKAEMHAAEALLSLLRRRETASAVLSGMSETSDGR